MSTPTGVVETYFDALGRGDLDAVGSAFADDVVWHQPGTGSLSGTYRGKQELFALLGRFVEFSGGSFRIDRVDAIMANDDHVAATLHFSARRGERAISMDGVDVFRIAPDGHIAEVWLFSQDQTAEDEFWG